jgi:hypothetical protein
MIIGFIEFGEIRVYEDISHVLDAWAKFPTDLLSDVIVLYDDDGTWLEPVATYRKRKWFPWLKTIESVQLVRNENDHHQDSLPYLLHNEAKSLATNHLVKSLQELRIRYPFKNLS